MKIPFYRKIQVKTKLSPDEVLKRLSNQTMSEEQRNLQLISFQTFVGFVNRKKKQFKLYQNMHTMDYSYKNSAKIILIGTIKRQTTGSMLDITVRYDWFGILLLVLITIFFAGSFWMLWDTSSGMLGTVIFMQVLLALSVWAILYSYNKKEKALLKDFELALKHLLTINIVEKKGM